ncbi:PAS domain S-box protein [Leeuwenhoekiella sp. MAR_2009_132]|uniref:PAS domain S-box protein n=1 Tax=Leeuwenhoekiella sp. MAR_2009_132 TaxID=1392489 RepID=UPI00048F1815|nr:PAS domain S-box protein [Leeuwenhoekiella sp. MAR_2009_132]
MSENRESYNKIFIEQAPIAIAMLDKNMCYLSVSKKWVADYKMEGRQIIGRSHYDLFPEIGDDWKANHQKCLNGAIDVCDEAPFIRGDGSVQWIYWDVRPWYISENEIGGLIMHTGDITHIKNNDEERKKIEKILENTNEIARIGIWEVNLITNEVYWSKVVYEIHEVSDGFIPQVETNIKFYKEGKNRDLILKAMKEAVEDGIPFDLEVEIETATGKTIWARSIGQPEMVDGKCVRLAGMFQDINKMKVSQLALNKANVEMNAILNSGSVAIISTDNNGIINHFNKGAEELLGYSALEVIGIHSPVIFHLKDEIDSFQKNLSKLPDNSIYQQDSTNLLNNLDFTGTREWTYRRKNDSTLPVELTVTAITNDNGERIGFLGISSDITERKKAQNELIRKNQLLNFAEEITKIGHWQWDIVNDRIKWSNNLFNIFEIDNTTSNLKFDTYLNFVHPDDKVLVTTNFQNAINNNGFENFNHRIKTNGKTKTIQLIGKVFKNEKGIVTEMIGTCQDVTEQKMAENKFRGLLESAPDAMVIVNEKGCIQLINKQAEKLFGYTLDEIFDKPVEILIPKRFTGNNAHIGLRDSFFAKPKVKAFGMGNDKELFGVNKAGKEIPIQISLGPLETEEGLLVSAAIRDITAQKLAENELLRNNQLLNFAEEITLMGNWQWDLKTNKLKWSKNMYKIFDVDRSADLEIKTYLDFIHPEDRANVDQKISESLGGLAFNKVIHRIILNDGTIKIIQLLGVIAANHQGNVTEMVGTCQDITAPKMAENKFRGLLESAPDAMVIVNEKGRIQLINKQAEKLFKYTQEELYDKPVEILIPQRFTGNNAHIGLRDGFFAKPKVKAFGVGSGKDLFGVNKEGKEIPIQISLSPLQTEEGLLVSAAIRDITTQKLASRKILEAKENLEVLANKLTAQNTQLADFVHITSHNLRAPVSNLNSLLEFYNTSESEEEKEILFEKFEKVINHLTLTLNTLIEALRTKSDSAQDVEQVSFSEVMHKTQEILSGEILESGIVIITDFSQVATITYNTVYLESIFLNLVSNAIKYRAKDKTPEIFIKSEIIDKKIILSFKDNGLGIDLMRNGHKLFGLNKVFHRHPDAKGVGLFMTKIQVEAMGGTIAAKSKVNEGSTFTINFN